MGLHTDRNNCNNFTCKLSEGKFYFRGWESNCFTWEMKWIQYFEEKYMKCKQFPESKIESSSTQMLINYESLEYWTKGIFYLIRASFLDNHDIAYFSSNGIDSDLSSQATPFWLSDLPLNKSHQISNKAKWYVRGQTKWYLLDSTGIKYE